jgi:hypothetical protein
MLTLRHSPFGTCALLLCSVTFSSCYTELEEPEEAYSGVAVNSDPRPPETGAPGATTAAPGTTTPPAVTTAGPSTSGTVTGSGSTPPVPSGYVPTPGCEDVVGTIFASEEKCSGPACHGGASFVNLVDEMGMGERLLDKTSAFCSPTKYIDSLDPGASTIVSKLSATPCFGEQMPPASSGLTVTEAEKACIVEWVTAVADGHIVLQ